MERLLFIENLIENIGLQPNTILTECYGDNAMWKEMDCHVR